MFEEVMMLFDISAMTRWQKIYRRCQHYHELCRCMNTTTKAVGMDKNIFRGNFWPKMTSQLLIISLSLINLTAKINHRLDIPVGYSSTGQGQHNSMPFHLDNVELDCCLNLYVLLHWVELLIWHFWATQAEWKCNKLILKALHCKVCLELLAI